MTLKPMAALWRLVLSAVGSVLLLVLVVNVVTQPVDTKLRSYTAEFTDASGLHLGGDVRVRGVRVGKVDSLNLERRNGQSLAEVKFTLDTHYGVLPVTRLAIRFQALTGLRYIDVINPAENYSATDLVRQVPISMTQPSFDITSLFNGLQPVIATLSPADLNTFTANAATFLTGDGEGLAPVLDSMRKLTAFLSNRQDVVATLMHNLADVANSIGGQSQSLIKLMDMANEPIDATLGVINEFRKSQLYGPEFAKPVVQLFRNLGFLDPGVDIDSALDKAISNVDETVDAFKLIPVMWANIPPPAPDGAPEPCSRGAADLPMSMDVLLNGRRVMLCNN